ncbi:hypothetical protein KC368_g85 [Hortaea werneckii]|nr:hypothetical protein KC368_g85 [Hortaea werneckii]
MTPNGLQHTAFPATSIFLAVGPSRIMWQFSLPMVWFPGNEWRRWYFGTSMAPVPPAAYSLARPKPRRLLARLPLLCVASWFWLILVPGGADRSRVTSWILLSGSWNERSFRIRLWCTRSMISAKLTAELLPIKILSTRNMRSCVLPSGSFGPECRTGPRKHHHLGWEVIDGHKDGQVCDIGKQQALLSRFALIFHKRFESLQVASKAGMKLNKKLVAEKPFTLTGAGTVGAKAFETRVLGR